MYIVEQASTSVYVRGCVCERLCIYVCVWMCVYAFRISQSFIISVLFFHACEINRSIFSALIYVRCFLRRSHTLLASIVFPNMNIKYITLHLFTKYMRLSSSQYCPFLWYIYIIIQFFASKKYFSRNHVKSAYVLFHTYVSVLVCVCIDTKCETLSL